MTAASAPIVAFTDDDCYVEPSYLSSLFAVFVATDYGYIGGRVLLHSPHDAPVTIREDNEAEVVPARSIVRPGFLHGANFAFRRELWAALGGFDETLGAGTRFPAEDIDFVARASASGVVGAYVPGPTVRHHHGRKPGPEIENLERAYARGIAAFLVKACMDPSRRAAYGRYWYWRLASRLKRGRIREVAREGAAALEYLWALRFSR